MQKQVFNYEHLQFSLSLVKIYMLCLSLAIDLTSCELNKKEPFVSCYTMNVMCLLQSRNTQCKINSLKPNSSIGPSLYNECYLDSDQWKTPKQIGLMHLKYYEIKSIQRNGMLMMLYTTFTWLETSCSRVIFSFPFWENSGQ